MNPGIDYGRGVTNVDLDTSIRYGVIATHELSVHAVDDIYTHGEDVGFTAAKEELVNDLARSIQHTVEDFGSISDDAAEAMALEIVESDDYQWHDLDTSGPYEYSGDGYVLRTMSDNTEIFVLKSPYYTRAQFCSPCAPGAGYLPNYCEDGPKVYCLGPDWFDNGNPPYRKIWSVEDDTLVFELPVVGN